MVEMELYFSIIMRTKNGFDFTKPSKVPDLSRDRSISDHYDDIMKSTNVVDVVYRSTELDAIVAAKNSVEREIGRMTR